MNVFIHYFLVAQQCMAFILLFTVDNVMVALERLIFKVADPIQEFILRRLLGELQEVNNKPCKSIYSSSN